MIPKLKVYLDVDETTIETMDCVAKWYTKKYKNHPEYKQPNPKLIRKWHFEDEMPLMTQEDVIEVFNSTFFWENVKLKPHVYEVLERLHKSEKFDFEWCSIGSTINVDNKEIFLTEEFPFIVKFNMITNNGEITMGNKYTHCEDHKISCLIDDHISNLEGFKYPILFKDNEIDKDWNTGWKGMSVKSWLDVESLLMGLYDVEFMYT